jgi:hypothetical protein
LQWAGGAFKSPASTDAFNIEENKMTTKSIIATVFILSATSWAHAQQVIAASTQEKPSVAAQSGDDKTEMPTNRKTGKTRSEVLAELQQAQADGTALPTGFVAFDDAAHDAKYSGRSQPATSY